MQYLMMSGIAQPLEKAKRMEKLFCVPEIFKDAIMRCGWVPFAYSHMHPHLHVMVHIKFFRTYPVSVFMFWMILAFFRLPCTCIMQVILKFSYIIISHNGVVLLSNLKAFTMDLSCLMLLRQVVMLILLGGNVYKIPCPLSFSHWNLGGLSTDNFFKKFLSSFPLC